MICRCYMLGSQIFLVCFVFFFKQKTAYEMRISDWSSDVCSSDLPSVTIIVQLSRGGDVFIDLREPSKAARPRDCRLRVCERRNVGLCVLTLVRFAKGDVLDNFSVEIGPELLQATLPFPPGPHISCHHLLVSLSPAVRQRDRKGKWIT